MTIQDEIRAELKDAMRAKDQLRLDVLGQIETEVSVAKSAPDFIGEIDDELYRKVIGAYVKRMHKAIEEYRRLGSRAEEMATKLSFEVGHLGRWLPRRLDEQATRELVRQAIAELGVAGPQAAGRATGLLMEKHHNTVEGALVSRIVREELEPR